MQTIPETHPLPKRLLTKVRRRFLHKTPDPLSPQDTVLAPQRSKTPTVNILNPCIGLVEVNGKIYLGVQNLNPYLILSNPQIEVHANTRAVTLNLQYIEGLNHQNYEECIRKLESYGDLQLAQWAARLKRYHQSYPILMANYFNNFHSGDSVKLSNMRKAKNRALLAIREIEDNCAYRKLLNFFGRDSAKLIKTSYSESLLREMGYTLEEFVAWTNAHGVPRLFDENVPAHMDIAKDFLDNVHFDYEPVTVGNEYTAKIVDKHGNVKTVIGQYTHIVEPNPEGIFVSGYFVLKRVVEVQEGANSEDRISSFYKKVRNSLKAIKRDSHDKNDKEKEKADETDD